MKEKIPSSKGGQAKIIPFRDLKQALIHFSMKFSDTIRMRFILFFV